MISIIVPLYNGWSYTSACLSSLAGTTTWVSHPDTVEVILVDNGSEDETSQHAAADILIRNWSNKGFAVACNQGGALANGDTLVFLNNDTECQKGWLDAIMMGMAQKRWDMKVGIVGPKLVWPNGGVQHTGISMSNPNGILTATNREDEHESCSVEAVTGACLAITAELFDLLGGFDERFYNGYEDVDLCLRARREGFTCWYESEAVVMHVGSASGPERWARTQQNIDLLNERWNRPLKQAE